MKNLKNFILLLLLLVILTPLNTFAGKGYDISNTGVNWLQNSGVRKCPIGKVLLDKWKIKTQDRAGTAKCFIADNRGPTISYYGTTANGSRYYSGKWTKDEGGVNIKITLSDSGSGLGKSYYTINGKRFEISSSSFYIPTIKEEGTYRIEIYAEDRAIFDSYKGDRTNPNTSRKTIIVNIDQNAPVFGVLPNVSDREWTNETSINFKIEDTFQGKNIKEKIYDCGYLPNNAIWNYPVNADNGEILGYCESENSGEDCLTDNDFYPNGEQCNYICMDDYIRGSDGNCYTKTQKEQCNLELLPNYIYEYNKDDNIEIEQKSSGEYLWNQPFGVEISGVYYSDFDQETLDYLPTTSECDYKCEGGYHLEGTKCVSDTKIVCCDNPYLSTSTLGTQVDCIANPNDIACINSEICGWDKELLGLWDNNSWDYITTTDGSNTKEKHCGYKYFDNSNGRQCNSFYSLLVNNGKPIICNYLEDGFWSGQDNLEYKCTNRIPKNSYYSSNGDKNNCGWSCDKGYIKDGNSCVEDEDQDEGTECEGGVCTYILNKNFYNNDSCSNLEGNQEIKSTSYNTIEDCNKSLDNEELNKCIELGKSGNFIKKILVNGCE